MDAANDQDLPLSKAEAEALAAELSKTNSSWDIKVGLSVNATDFTHTDDQPHMLTVTALFGGGSMMRESIVRKIQKTAEEMFGHRLTPDALQVSVKQPPNPERGR